MSETPETNSSPLTEEVKSEEQVITDAPTAKKSKKAKLVDEVKRVEGELIEDVKKVETVIAETIVATEEKVEEVFIATAEDLNKIIERHKTPTTKLPDIPTLEEILRKQHGVKAQ